MRTFTLEPILDRSPILVVDGEGTVLESNLAWTRLASTRRRGGLRSNLYDIVSFVGAALPPTASTGRELQVHHVVLREAEGTGQEEEPLSTALLVPVVHRRRDTYMVVLLSPRLFHPDAIRFAELLALDVAPRSAPAEAASAADDDAPLELSVEIEGALRAAADLAEAVVGSEAGGDGELAALLADRVRRGVPGRRIAVAVRRADAAGVPTALWVAEPGDEAAVRRAVQGWHAPVEADRRAVATETAVDGLPAWLQRLFADVAPENPPPRFLAVAAGSAAGDLLLAAGPWRGTEPVAPDERLLMEMAATLGRRRLLEADAERQRREEARRLGHALQAERVALGRTEERLAPVALSARMAAAVERGRALETLGRPYAVVGPAGAGRRTLVRWLAAVGPRRDAPAVEVGCRFQDEAALRERLFGGPDGEPPGALALAATGTLLLADIDHLPPALQPRLLEALRPRPAAPLPPLVVATAALPPEALAQAGTLLPDLAALFASRVVSVPALGERPEDLVPLAVRFAAEAAEAAGRPVPRLAPRAIDRLLALPWRGHVRELRAALEGAVALAPGALVDAEHLPGDQGALLVPPAAAPPPVIDLSLPFADLKRAWIDHFERAYLDAALRRTGGNLSAAARLARLDKKNFHEKAARLGLAGPGERLKPPRPRRSIPGGPGDDPEGGSA